MSEQPTSKYTWLYSETKHRDMGLFEIRKVAGYCRCIGSVQGHRKPTVQMVFGILVVLQVTLACVLVFLVGYQGATDVSDTLTNQLVDSVQQRVRLVVTTLFATAPALLTQLVHEWTIRSPPHHERECLGKPNGDPGLYILSNEFCWSIACYDRRVCLTH